ncbi:TonB-dependent receptor [Fulvivirga sp. RKSG066]|uniref:TonB-dependent receptor n=1 Tax=Fulvivirga aurantia TaxID=2529383 RepID=UPI0012BD0F48|nr:TonB-dependent receptor [Fulvivirga aurantia]MTI22076.1 TonB-dependent receptor [Fulvivirga aurantia]
MKKIFTKMTFLLFLLIGSVSFSYAQSTKISGTVTDLSTGDPLAGVNIVVKGKVTGTISDPNGEFNLSVDVPTPFILQFSFIGFETQEIEVTESESVLNVTMEEATLLGQEVVVSASRVEESILESPVSIEKMDIRAIREAAAPNFYDAIKSLKGIDVSTQSMTFSSINPRGFGANGNTRTVQLIDGIDNQAPGLNFPVGNIVGINELDLESVEILPGAASALYGPNAIQGIILMNSKSPFEYQGLSVTAKMGLNHVDEEDDDMSVYHNYALRYAKAFNNKVAFKVTASYLRANDWRGVDYRNQSGLVENSNEFDPTVDGYRDNVRTYDGVNVYGEPLVNLGAVADGVIARGTAPGASAEDQALAAQVAATRSLYPDGENGNFTPLGFTEREFVDNTTESLKLGTALHYRLNDELELIGQYNIGYGSTVYTANDRFVLDDFSIWTGKLELRGTNFFVRGYTTQEDAGDSYAANTLGSLINAETYIPEYFSNFAGARSSGQSVDQAHAFARANSNRLEVGSDTYNEAFDRLRQTPISEGGAQFLDETSLYHGEFMYNFADKIDFAEIIVGGNFRRYNLKSGGTLFALENIDTGDEFDINEFGGYLQLQKSVADERLDLTGSIRYDKNENFDGQFSPRVSAVYTMGDNRNHNLRASFQRGFRIPTTQDQFINLDVVTRRLVGSNSALVDQFNFRDNTVYTLESVSEAQRENDASLLVAWDDFDFETEKVSTYEFGYKSLIQNKLLIDAYYYYSQYTDFIVEVDLVQTAANNTSSGQTPLYNGPADPNGIAAGTANTARYGFDVNSEETVNTQGWAIGAEYSLPRGFQLGGNISYNELMDAEELREQGFRAQFNTPEWKYNIKFANRKVTDNFGFSINYRWQDAFIWESSFGEGVIPAFGTLDAQVSYKLPSLKSVLKLGGSNILNERYTTSFGNPRIGALYYVSITFDEFFN